MDFEGPKYPVVMQTNGKSDRLQLLDLCQAAGYYMYDEGSTLVITRDPSLDNTEPLGFVLRWGDLLDKIIVRDKAQTDAKKLSSKDKRDQLQMVEAKTTVDGRLGTVEQIFLDNKKSIGKGRKDSTGFPAPTISSYASDAYVS